MPSKKEFLEIINQKTERNDNGCLIWNGPIEYGLCRLNYYDKSDNKRKVYFVHNLVWNLQHTKHQIDRKKEKCIRTCGEKTCVELSHLKLVSIKKELSKEEIWSRLLEKGERQESGCLYWKGDHYLHDYGRTSINGQYFSVHRLSYCLHHDIKQLPTLNEEGVRMMIRHICNHPQCFEPTHLKLGTQYENDYDDKIENNTLQRGPKHYNSSITEEKAKEIKLSKRDKSEADYQSQRQRAEQFGVSLDLLKSIDCGKSWAYLPDRNGNTCSKRKIKARGIRKKAKDKVWTDEMFEQARNKLLKNIQLSETINEPFVTTPCHLWKGKTCDDGYACTSIFGKCIRTHILACEIKNKKHRPKDQVTRHLCGNKLCCNPDHLEFGTSTENAIDNVKHGKSQAKLNGDIVREIRETNGKDGLTKVERAKKYNISKPNLQYIEKNKTWKHI